MASPSFDRLSNVQSLQPSRAESTSTEPKCEDGQLASYEFTISSESERRISAPQPRFTPKSSTEVAFQSLIDQVIQQHIRELSLVQCSPEAGKMALNRGVSSPHFH